MKKITGYIVFVGSIVILIFLIYVGIRESNYGFDFVDFLLWILPTLVCLCALYYTCATKFWTTKLTVLESIERENEIIKRQIEKKELLNKLDSLIQEKK